MTEVNLGTALSLGTNLGPDASQPFTRVMQVMEQDAFKQAQIEMKKAAAEKKRADFAAKMLTVKGDTKWYNPKYGEEFGKYYSSQIPKLADAYQSGDAVTYAQLEQDVKNKLGMLKAMDNDEEELLNKNVRGSISRETAKELYKQQGIKGIQAHDSKYWFAQLANVDEKSGHFRVNDFIPVDINKTIVSATDRIMSAAGKYKPTGSKIGTSLVYEVDVNDLEFGTNKNKIFNELLADDKLRGSIYYSKDFKDFYSRKLKAKGIMDEAATEDDLENIYEDYLLDRFNKNLIPKVRISGSMANQNKTSFKQVPGGGFMTGGWLFMPSLDEGVFDVSTKATGWNPELSFDTGVGKINLGKNHKIKYLGDDEWEVTGVEKSPFQGIPDEEKTVRVTTSNIQSNFGLNTGDLINGFGYSGKLVGKKTLSQGGGKTEQNQKPKQPYKAKVNASSR